MTAETEMYAEKIGKLLRKAESTTPEEAELLVSKAQELMTRYAVTEAMLEAAAEGETKKIIEENVNHTGIYRAALHDITAVIAKANDCRVLQSTWQAKNTHTTHVIGFEDDVHRVQMLDASLQIQAVGAMQRWWKQNRDDMSYLTGMERFKARRDFFFGFAGGLRAQLEAARHTAEEEYVAEEAENTDTPQEQVSESVALVMRSKRERVKDWVDETYGDTLRTVSRNYSTGFGGARAGHEAGRNADTGRPGVGRSKGALPR